MQISEVSSGDSVASDVSNDQLCPPLQQLEKLVVQVEQMAPVISPDVVGQLQALLPSIPAKLREDQKIRLWKLSYNIWNTCVLINNNLPPGQNVNEEHARLRHFASDLLIAAGSVGGVRSSLLKTAMFYHRTGTIWHKLSNYGMAAACYEKATELGNRARDHHQAGKPSQAETEEEESFLFELYVSRAKTAWELSQKALACSLLGRARGMLQPSSPAEQYEELAEQFFHYGKLLLARSDKPSHAESVSYLEQAFEICSEGVLISSQKGKPGSTGLGSEEDGQILTNLKVKVLRYLAAGHLHNENFESVLKCVSLLKAGPDHASTSFLALKAYLGLKRFEEAEEEACILVSQRGTPVDVCAAAIDVLIESSAASLLPQARLDAVKKLYSIAHSRFPFDIDLTLRALEKLLTQPLDQHCKKRIEVALGIALDEKTVDCIKRTASSFDRLSQVASHAVSNAQQCAYSLLWNSGTEFFQAKDYNTSIQLFEASLMYLSSTDTNFSSRRSKNLRILCICHIALGQYDRASDYADEADKLEVSVAGAFLKFKICLQTNDEEGASQQVEKMFKCPDFETDYLTLASHEAISCKCISVAISALSRMLDLCPSAKSSDTKEVVIIRNIILLSTQDTNSNPSKTLKYFKLARSRLAKIGSENFFGDGSTGDKEAQWFSGSAWNEGLAAAKSQKWILCAEFFLCAADFYECLQETTENLRLRRTSMLIAVGAMLLSNTEEDLHLVREAAQYLEKCHKVHEILRSKMLSTNDQTTDTHLNLLMFEVKGRLKDRKAQLDIVCHCSALPGFEPKYFYTMGQSASSAGAAEVAMAAFEAGLNMTLASASLDYGLVAATIRKLITLADSISRDSPKAMSLYQQANQILLGLSLEVYPKEEVQWLVSTAWNRAALHAKFSRYSVAEKWMNLALDLLKHAPFMESHRPAMLESLSTVLRGKTNEAIPMDE